MLNILKKWFTVNQDKDKEPIVETFNYDLIDRMATIIYSEDFDSIYFKSVSKICLMSMYSTSLPDLLDNFTNRNFNRSISAVSLHDYFKDSHRDLQRQFLRIMKILPTVKLHPLVEHDLIEFFDTYTYLKELEA